MQRVIYTAIRKPFKVCSPSADRYHLTVRRHEELGAVPQVLVAVHADPGVLRPLRVQREEEGLTGAEVRLAVAPVVLQVPLAPFRRAVGSEYLKAFGKGRFSGAEDPNRTPRVEGGGYHTSGVKLCTIGGAKSLTHPSGASEALRGGIWQEQSVWSFKMAPFSPRKQLTWRM